jgi:invasion protein IalB
MEDHLFGITLRSKAAAVFGALALATALPVSTAQAQSAQPAQPAAQAPKPEMFGNWGLVCPQPKACQIQVVLVNQERKFVAALAYAKNGARQSLVGIVPLGFRLQHTPVFTVDGANPVNGTYVQCLASGCRISIPANDGVVRALQGGNQATLALLSPANKEMPLNFDLKGFADAKRALDQRTQ